MNIQENLSKISWSALDKILLLLFGVISLFQLKATDAANFGLYSLLLALMQWLCTISDSFALQGLIQLGMQEKKRVEINTIALFILVLLLVPISLAIFLLKDAIADIFNSEGLVSVAGMIPILVLLTLPRLFGIKAMYRDSRIKEVFFINFAHFGTMGILIIYYLYTFDFLDYEVMSNIYLYSHVISAIVSLLLLKSQNFQLKFTKIEFKNYVNFSWPLFLDSLFWSTATRLDTFIVQYLFSVQSLSGATTEAAGIYAAAKNLFRFFDEGISAMVSLVYPAAVRKIQKKQISELHSLITKAFSFIFFTFTFIVGIIYTGIFDYFITHFLKNEKYINALEQFDIFLINAFVLPFIVFPILMIADTQLKKKMTITFFAMLASFLTFYIIGQIGNPLLSPLALFSFYLVISICSFVYYRNKYGFELKMFFRAFTDSKYYLIKLINKFK